MGDWKSCDNCSRHNCNCENLRLWKPIPCKYCNGPLSEIREHNGRRYRHCYACHSEFFIGGENT